MAVGVIYFLISKNKASWSEKMGGVRNVEMEGSEGGGGARSSTS